MPYTMHSQSGATMYDFLIFRLACVEYRDMGDFPNLRPTISLPTCPKDVYEACTDSEELNRT